VPLHATPPARHADVTKRLRDRGVLRDLAKPAGPRNLDAAAALATADTCTFRGVAYTAPPIPVHVGFMLVSIQRRLTAAIAVLEQDSADAPEAIAHATRDLLTVAEEAAVVFREFATPVGFWRRLQWRLDRRYNPFRWMSAAELGGLLVFFSARQAASRFSMPGSPTPSAVRAA
jgi:hypothetical protein